MLRRLRTVSFTVTLLYSAVTLALITTGHGGGWAFGESLLGAWALVTYLRTDQVIVQSELQAAVAAGANAHTTEAIAQAVSDAVAIHLDRRDTANP